MMVVMVQLDRQALPDRQARLGLLDQPEMPEPQVAQDQQVVRQGLEHQQQALDQ